MAWVSTLRHKTATCVCLEETFLLLFLYLNPYLLPAAPLRVWKLWVRGKVCPPAQEFGKRGGVFQILMPTAPTRIKLSPALLSLLSRIYLPCLFFGDVLTLPVRLRPPEMAIVLEIEALCRYWEGAFVSGGWKRRVCLKSGGRKSCSGGRGCLVICLEVADAGVVLSREGDNVTRTLVWVYVLRGDI